MLLNVNKAVGYKIGIQIKVGRVVKKYLQIKKVKTAPKVVKVQ